MLQDLSCCFIGKIFELNTVICVPSFSHATKFRKEYVPIPTLTITLVLRFYINMQGLASVPDKVPGDNICSHIYMARAPKCPTKK